MADAQKMMAGIVAGQERFDELIARMNGAAGQAKIDQMAAFLTELAAQRKAMHAHMRNWQQAPPPAGTPTARLGRNVRQLDSNRLGLYAAR